MTTLRTFIKDKLQVDPSQRIRVKRSDSISDMNHYNIGKGQKFWNQSSWKGNLFLWINILRHGRTAFPSNLSILLRSV